MEKTKVLLSDPQVLFREGIHFVLSGEDDIEVAGETTSNEEALSLVEASPPNIVLLSLEDKKSSGLEIARRIRRSQPAVAVILTMGKKDEEKVFEAIKAGISACLTRDTDPEQLLDVVRAVMKGELPILEELAMPKVATMALGEFENLASLGKPMESLFARLTPREAQVLSHLAGGLSPGQVATKLEIDEDAVRRHLRQVLNKLIANDQAQAVIEATQKSFSPIVRLPMKKEGKAEEYVTRAEFNAFKDRLMERLKNLLGEIA